MSRLSDAERKQRGIDQAAAGTKARTLGGTRLRYSMGEINHQGGLNVHRSRFAYLASGRRVANGRSWCTEIVWMVWRGWLERIYQYDGRYGHAARVGMGVARGVG